MKVTLRFYNGDEDTMEIVSESPPGRLSLGGGSTMREFWLDTAVWSAEGRAEYREVAPVRR